MWRGQETGHNNKWRGQETGHNNKWRGQETGHNKETGHNNPGGQYSLRMDALRMPIISRYLVTVRRAMLTPSRSLMISAMR